MSEVMVRGISYGTEVVILILLVLVFWKDMRERIIPNRLLLWLCLPVVIQVGLGRGMSVTDRMGGMLCVSLPMFLLAVTKGGFGGGDVKLMAVMGAYLGWQKTLVAFAVAVLTAGVFLLPGLWKGGHEKKDLAREIPFGPFLCAGIMVAMCAGRTLIAWYTGDGY